MKNVFARDRSELSRGDNVCQDITSARDQRCDRMEQRNEPLAQAHPACPRQIGSCSRCMEPMRSMSVFVGLVRRFAEHTGLPMARVSLMENPQLNAFAATRGTLRWSPRLASLTVDDPRRRDRP